MTEFVPKETLKDVLELPFVDIPDRKIRKETCEKFGVRGAVSERDGRTLEALYFPSYDQKGVVRGFKKMDLSKSKGEKGHWSVVASVQITNKLFGQDVAEGIKRKRSSLTYVEGELDCLSLYQAMRDQVKGTKFEDLEPFVVSVPMGTANAQEATIHNEAFIRSFEACCIAFDSDCATPVERLKKIKRGLEAREDVAAVLSDMELTVVDYPDGFKDASDMLQAGKSDELAKLVQFGKKPYTAEKIITASSIELDEILAPRVEGVYTGVFPKLDHKLHGFRPRELVVFTAPSNVGKSLVTSHFMYRFLEAGERIGMMMLEETAKESIQRLMSMRLKVNYNRFKENPLACASQEEIQDAYNWVTKEREVFLLDHFGSMPLDTLMNKIKSFVHANKVKYLLLDHIGMILGDAGITDERRELDMVMTKLAAFCAASDVCVILVSHLNRSIAEGFKPPKGKESEPFWVPITKEALRSSSCLEQLAWTVLGLEPQIRPDKSRGNVRLTVMKNRAHGYLGICDEFYIDDETGEVVLVDNEAPTF
jgi:KaiC/GvpD/RAD55 family RecA-like ATPase